MREGEYRSEPGEERVSSVTLEDAVHEAVDAVLLKPDNIQEAIQELDVPPEQKQQLETFRGYGRDVFHLLRMLQKDRSPAEHAFAGAYLANLDRVKVGSDVEDVEAAFGAQSQFDDIDSYAEFLYGVRKVIGGEGSDTKMWWTFAPYLYEALHEQGIEDQEIVRRLILWTKDAATDYRFEESDKLHLPGLTDLVDVYGRANTYVLSRDPEGPTHRFTRERARKIVKEYLNA